MILALAALALPCACALAAPDPRVLAAAEKAQPALIESLKEMVLIESGSADKAGLAKMVTLIDQRLQALGFKTERHRVGDSADTVIGTRHVSGKARIMLLAHMDTVYPPGVLASQPVKVQGNRLYGPGSADAKGGIAVILHALQLLLDAGWRDFATLTVVVNGDEETGSASSGELIAQLGAQHDTVLSFEPSAAKSVVGGEPLTLGTAGVGTATLEVKGRASHAGAAPEQGRNAVIELAHQLLQTRDIAKDIPGAQLNWTTLRTDNPNNQIPALAVAVGDVRILQPGADEKLKAALQAQLAERLVSDTEVSLKFELHRPPFVAGERGRKLFDQAKAIYAEIDRPLGSGAMGGGGTDAAFAARSGKPVVLESFGLPGSGYHAKDEYIEIDSIVPRLYLASRLLVELGRK